MFLTEEEFIILSALKIGLNNKEIKEKFKIQIYTNDPRLAALCKKYGIYGYNFKKKLVKTTDLKQITVLPINKIPFYQYEGIELVNKIKIRKKDITKLNEFFKNVSDDSQEYELIYNEDYFNLFKFLEIKDLNTNKKYEIRNDIG